jgi:hypothetical protein
LKGSLLIAIGLCALLAGCREAGVSGSITAQAAPPRVSESLPATDPDPISLSQALEALASAYGAVQDAKAEFTGPTEEGLGEAADYLDGAGAVVAEQASSQPSLLSLEDALADVESAVTILDSLAEQSEPAAKERIFSLVAQARKAAKNLEGALNGLRG